MGNYKGFALPVTLLFAGITLLPLAHGNAQTLTTLHSFSLGDGPPTVTNDDGAQTQAGVVVVSNTVYGTATYGGSNASGTIYAVNVSGSGFTNLHTFSELQDPQNTRTNADGANPWVGMIAAGGVLYGTTGGGGPLGGGVLFKINTNGSGFAVVHPFPGGFTNYDGSSPQAELILSGNTLYGTTEIGGDSGLGTVFRVNTDGSGFTNLHNFEGADGSYPYGRLVLSGTTLFGTASEAGRGNGTVFALNTDGSSFTNLYDFAFSDGSDLWSGLILYNNTLYGTARDGGSAGNGTIYSVNTNGTGFTVLHNFIDDDGESPLGELHLSGNILYGTTSRGGLLRKGTVFSIDVSGSGFTNLFHFSKVQGAYFTNSDGATPEAGVFLSGNTLYGTTTYGSGSGNGAVFALPLSAAPIGPTLVLTQAGSQFVVSWPTNATGYSLQFITNLSSGSWSNISNGITVAGTNFVYTNTLTGNPMFFRLIK